jgi:signal transduction histidine kinase
LTFDLSSPTLYKFGLEAALEELLEDKMRGQHGLECHFFHDDQAKPLTDDLRVLLFRSVRELLVNVIKHARARQVSLDIRCVKDSIEITVTDDGVGCDVSGMFSTLVHQRHFGLLSVRERLEYVGGRLEICSQLGRGSRFTLLAPLDLSVGDTGRSRDGGQDSAGG